METVCGMGRPSGGSSWRARAAEEVRKMSRRRERRFIGNGPFLGLVVMRVNSWKIRMQAG
jgi:hypothetical protein